MARQGPNRVMMSRRTRGSPPVMRSLRTPALDEHRADAVELLERQKVALRQEGHVLGHAIDAAEIAAVRHRDAQIGDRPPERVDERRGRGRGRRLTPHEASADLTSGAALVFRALALA